MANTFVGLDIGTSAVRAAELSVGRDGVVTLIRFGQIALSPGAVVAGEVADPDLVSGALRRLWREVGFSTKKVVVGVGNQRVVVRPDTLPDMEADELRTAIEFKADELIPIPLDEVILDFQEIERDVDEDGQPVVRVLVVGAQRDMVSSLLEAVEGAGLDLQLVDLVPFGLIRSLADVDLASIDDDDETISDAIVSIGAGVTHVVVHDMGVPRFIRILMIGSESVNEGLATEFDLSPDEAEDLKRRITAGNVPIDINGRADDVLDDRMAPLIDEIRSSLDFHLAQNGGQLRRVVLTGGGGRSPRIGEKLQALLGVPVVKADPFARIAIGDTGLSEAQLRAAADLAATPIGLALAGRPSVGGVRRLDLQPPEIAAKRAGRRNLAMAGVGLLVLALLLGALWQRRQADIDDLQVAAQQIEAANDQLRAEIGAEAEISSIEADAAERRDLVRAALRNDVAWTKLIQEIATVMPDDTWISAFRGEAPAQGSPGSFTVSGNGFDHTSSARWVLRLEPLPGVATLSLPSSSRSFGELGLGESTFTSQGTLSDSALSDRVEEYVGLFPAVIEEASSDDDADDADEEASR